MHVRPCPYVGCRYNLHTDDDGTSMVRVRTELEMSTAGRHQATAAKLSVLYWLTGGAFLVDYESCALDVADTGAQHTTGELADLMGIWHTNAERALLSAEAKARTALEGYKPG